MKLYLKKQRLLKLANISIVVLTLIIPATYAEQPSQDETKIYKPKVARPSANMLAKYPNKTFKGFGDTRIDKFFGHTFTSLNIPGKTIVGATLEIQAKPTKSSQSNNDALHLKFFGAGGNSLASGWDTYFGSGNSNPGLLSNQWIIIFYQNGHTFNLNLENINKNSIINQLNTNTFLDVLVENDTIVESIKLTIKYRSACTPPPSNMVGWWPLDEQSGTTATDIVNSNNGTHMNSPVPTASGKVNGALEFYGANNDYVEVPDNSVLNFGEGDFSIDAWINNGSGPIVSKFSTGGIGYVLTSETCLCTSSPPGTRILILTVVGSGGGFNYEFCGEIPPDQLSHVAAVIDRDANTAKCYVNGVLQNTITIPITGSTTNSDPLFIGHSNELNNYYYGLIDEVELFNRALTTSEIQDIYNAGSAGKCKELTHLPWDVRPCQGENSVAVDATVCNYSTISQTYQLSSLLPSSSGNQCNFSMPSTINYTVTPTSALFTIPSGQCDAFELGIEIPTGISNTDIACYTANVNNINTGQIISDEGSIWGQTQWCLGIIDKKFNTLALSQVTAITVDVTNTGDTNETLEYTIVPVRSDMNESRPVSLSLNEEKPGVGISDKISLNAGETGKIEFKASLTQADPFSVNEAIIMADIDGDGKQEPLYSTAFLYNKQLKPEDPLSVTLDKFTTNAANGKITINWTTGTETNNAGFILWRATPINGQCSTTEASNYKDVRQVKPLVYSKAKDGVLGALYSEEDNNVESGITYCYGLEDIDYDGKRTFHIDKIISATLN
jgi:hypothetical protein